jgi:hypothetical protein
MKRPHVTFLAAAGFVVFAHAAAEATPFSPASLDSAIVSCLEGIRADRLQSYIQVLQDFQTRHTNSDTTSSTVGMSVIYFYRLEGENRSFTRKLVLLR